MYKVVVLGGGMVGGLMARDLANDPNIGVTVADRSPEVLEKLPSKIDTVQMDLSDTARVKSLVSQFDLAVGSVPGFMGFQTLKAVIAAGKSYTDISFMPEDPWELEDLARDRGVTAVVDCGVAPAGAMLWSAPSGAAKHATPS